MNGETLGTIADARLYEYDSTNGNDDVHIIMYHANCLDGFAAAYAAHVNLLRNGARQGLYVPVSYSTRVDTLLQLQELMQGAHITIVDFSFPLTDVSFMVESGAQSVTILDHHAGAADDMAAINDHAIKGGFGGTPVAALFDNLLSGAVIAWGYFNKYVPTGIPPLFKFIQDRDLWKFEFGDDTRYVTAALYSMPLSFELFEYLLSTPTAVDNLLAEGRAIMRMRAKDIAMHAEEHNLDWGTLDGVKLVAVNAPCYVASELGAKLLEMHADIDAAVIYYVTSDAVQCSLRSREGGVDVAALVKPYGGGGHATAAGVRLTDDNMWDVIPC